MHGSRWGSRQFRQWGPYNIFFKSSTFFTECHTNLTGDHWGLIASRVWSVHVFLRKLITTCEFPGGGDRPILPPTTPPMGEKLTWLM